MRPCGLENEAELLLDCSGPEQHHHDKRVWKPHLYAVDCAVSGALDDCEEVLVSRVEHYALKGELEHRNKMLWLMQHYFHRHAPESNDKAEGTLKDKIL